MEQNSTCSLELDNIDELIQKNMGFIIKTVSGVTNRYVSLENDETLSVALLAFAEAAKRYESDRGNFFAFAKLVMESRLKTYLSKESKNNSESLEDMLSKEGDLYAKNVGLIWEDKHDKSNYNILQDEIETLNRELLNYGITFEELSESSPKHIDTRKNCVELAGKISKDDYMIEVIERKKKLPIKETSLRYNVTEKFLKRNKSFILTVVIIYHNNLGALSRWIKQAVIR
ncbi:MAG: RNA polymerase subunit sigma [Lachnospiraceae bacterium]|nr:RNA polymerase subunit sigma [Lachnospiraceae bacterium]